MNHYYCIDIETGEEFLVGANKQCEAILIALNYFEKPVVLDRYSEEQAEHSGLDEY